MAIAGKEIKVGYEIPPLSRKLTLERCQDYSGWPELRNFHTDEETAKKLGFPTVAMRGTMGAAYLSEMCTDFFGEGWIKGGRLSVNFIRVVHPPETLTGRGIVKEKVVEGSAVRLVLDVWLENGRGEKVIVGTAGGLVPP